MIKKKEHEISVLIVDDNREVVETCREMLENSFKFKKIFPACDGEEARRILKFNEIDLVLSDIKMPGLDGVSLLRKVNDKKLHIPAYILMTGFHDQGLQTEVHALGALAIIEKPFDEKAIRLIRKKLRLPS